MTCDGECALEEEERGARVFNNIKCPSLSHQKGRAYIGFRV
jgi:hypothetical protein